MQRVGSQPLGSRKGARPLLGRGAPPGYTWGKMFSLPGRAAAEVTLKGGSVNLAKIMVCFPFPETDTQTQM